MPLQLSTQTLAGGRPYVHVVGAGQVSGPEAQGLMTRIAKGGDLAGLPILGLLEGKVEMDPEARKAFATLNTGDRAGAAVKVGLVTPSAPMRVMLNFVIRLSPQVNETKFFATTAEALAWLETP